MNFKKEKWMKYDNKSAMNYNDITKAGGDKFVDSMFDTIEYAVGLDDFKMDPFIEYDLDDEPVFTFSAEGIMYNNDCPTKKSKIERLNKIETNLKNLGFTKVEVNYYSGDSTVVGDRGIDVSIKGEYELK